MPPLHLRHAYNRDAFDAFPALFSFISAEKFQPSAHSFPLNSSNATATIMGCASNRKAKQKRKKSIKPLYTQAQACIIPLEWHMNRSSGWHCDANANDGHPDPTATSPPRSNGGTSQWADANATCSATECNDGLQAGGHPAN